MRQLASVVFRKAGAQSKPFLHHWKDSCSFVGLWISLIPSFLSEKASYLLTVSFVSSQTSPSQTRLFFSLVLCKKFSQVYKMRLWIAEITF